MPGEGGTSAMCLPMRPEVSVLRLSMLGLRFIPGILGLMNTGDAGSEVTLLDATGATEGG